MNKTEIQKLFKNFLGDRACLTDADATQIFLHEWRGRMQGKAACVLLPENTEQVSAIVKLCAEHKIPITPQSGNTGLVGASVPDNELAVCVILKRMNKIRSINTDDFSMVAEAGCILQNAKEAAEKQKPHAGDDAGF